MADEIEIVNLFGKLALDTSLTMNTQKVEEQTVILNALGTLLTAIKANTLSVATQPVLPPDAATETTSEAIKDLMVLMKDLVESNHTILDTINTKIVKQDTDHIKGEVDVKSFPVGRLPLTNEELRGSSLPVSVQFPPSQKVNMDSIPLPSDAATETTLGAIKVLSNDIKSLISSVKTVVDNHTTILGSLDTKTIKQDTDHIAGSVQVTSVPLATGAATDSKLSEIQTLTSAIKDLTTTNNTLLTTINTKIVKQDTDDIKGAVSITGGALTNEELRVVPVAVAVSSLPADGKATETTLTSVLTGVASILNKLNASLLKADTDNVTASLVGIKENSMIRAMGRLSFDPATNNLRVLNTPSGTQTVSISGTPSVIAQTTFGNNSAFASSYLLGRLSFYKTLERITFT